MEPGLVDLLETRREPLRGKLEHVSEMDHRDALQPELSDYRLADLDEDTKELKMVPVRSVDGNRPPGSWAHAWQKCSGAF